MSEARFQRSRLGSIRAVTYTVPDLKVIEETYTRWLGYKVIARGPLPVEVAEAWRAPGVAHCPTLTLGPASGEAVYLRFIETAAAADWCALKTHGWNVSEFVVQDVDALAASLAESPFFIICPPASLTRFPMIRAMQVLGPFGECLYFTQVGPGSGLDLAPARSFVGRVFIVVAGAPDLEALLRSYSTFTNTIDPPVATPVRVISLVNDLPPETLHRHGLVKLGGGTLIELDQYPPVTRARKIAPDALPPGMAIVTLTVDHLPEHDDDQVHRVFLPDSEAPSLVWEGVAGELIEFVESKDA
jgi:hypothetical protein